MDIKNIVHHKIVEKQKIIEDWYADECSKIPLPVYSSFDIRDAGFKLGVVDANIFPAGFNNICQVDRENAAGLMKIYLGEQYHDTSKKNITLITEEHTNNAFYWENVRVLSETLKEAGHEIRIAIPKDLEKPMVVQSSGGAEITVHSAKREGDRLVMDGDFFPDLIISNNDFSESYEGWAEGLKTPINPPRELGWYQRKKSCYFSSYNKLLVEFSELLDLDPWFLQVETQNFSDFDLSDEEQKEKLANKAQELLDKTKNKYKEYKIADEPFLMMKNNSGTYGLAVIQIRSAEDIMSFNYKARKKMKAAKGGKTVEEVILQEGIPSIVQADNEVAEPSIYMIGNQLAGGFLRAHSKKGPKESLNSPGAVYKRLCVSDLKIDIEGHPLENSYGCLAKLGLLSIGRESQAMKVEISH